MRKYKAKKICKKAVAYIMLLSCISTETLLMPSSAYAAGAHADIDETMYLNLDYYGSVSKANVVKGINFNGVSSYTDFGKYINITNMSDEQKPDFKNGSVTWQKYDGGKFYFQGTLAPDSVEIPWNFDITYKLNGVVMDADKIGGKSGLVEMDIDAIPNNNVSEYMQNNMMLIVMIPVDVQKCYSVDAPDAQTATLGQYEGVIFEALPGKEGHFKIRLGTESFETVGAIFTMSPVTVSDLSKIKDLKEIKDDFRNDTNSMLDDFEDVLDGVTNVQDQLSLTNQMLAELKSGKDKLHSNAQLIFNGNDIAIQDLRDLQGTLEPLNEDLKTTQWMVYDINSNLNVLDSDLMDSSSKLNTLNKRLKQLGTSMSGASISNLDIKELSSDAQDAIDSLNDVAAGVNAMTNKVTDKSGREKIKASASEIVTNTALDNASDYAGYDKLNDKEKNLISVVSEKMGEDVDSISAGDLAAILAVADSDVLESDSDETKAKYIAYVKSKQSELAALQNAPVQVQQQAGAAAAEQGYDLTKIMTYAKVMQSAAGDRTILGKAAGYSKHLNTLLNLKNDTRELVNENISSDEELNSLADSLHSLTDSIENLQDENGDLFSSDQAEDLVNSIHNVISDLDEILEDGGAVSFQAARTLNTVRKAISDIDGLIGIMNAYYEDTQKLFEDSENIIVEMEKTSQDAAASLQNINNVLRSAEPDFNAAADDGIEIGKLAVENTGDIVDSTKHLKNTGRKLRDTINNKLDEEEADNNFLNMDPDAPKVSLTSDNNQEPTNISIICRSEEISVDDNEDNVLDSEIPDAGTTFLGRIKAVFTKMINVIASFFGRE